MLPSQEGEGKEKPDALQFQPWMVGKTAALAKSRTRDATVWREGRVTNEIISMLLTTT